MDYAGKKNPKELEKLQGVGKDLAFANFQAARQFNKKRDNGQLARRGMVWVGQGEQLRPRAAKAWKAMQTAAKLEGVSLGVTDAYRTLKEQKQLANQVGLYSQGGLAAKPGTSVHGKGRAVDVSYGPKSDNSLDSYNNAQAKWLKQNASKYGFSQPVAGEPWHVEFNPKQFNKEAVRGINLKVTNSGRVKAVVGPGFKPSTFTTPTWKPGKTSSKPTSVTDGKDSGSYQGGGGAIIPSTGSSGGMAEMGATLGRTPVF